MTGPEILTIMVSVIWISASLGTSVSKDTQPYGAAMITTIVIGAGYFILRLLRGAN